MENLQVSVGMRFEASAVDGMKGCRELNDFQRF